MGMLARPIGTTLAPTDVTAPTGTATSPLGATSSPLPIAQPRPIATGPTTPLPTSPLPPVTPPGAPTRTTQPLPPSSTPTLPTRTTYPGPTSPGPSAPTTPRTSTTTTNPFTGSMFGGGWDTFATPGTVQYALGQQFQQGNFGQTAVNNLNQNPSTAGIEYYPSTGQYGLPGGGYYVAPNATGAYDLIQKTPETGQPSQTGDSSGLLTSLMSLLGSFATSPQTQNTVASQPAPLAPATAQPSTTSPFLYGIDPTTGMPYGLNPATGQFSTPQSSPVTTSGQPALTTQSVMTSPTVRPVAGLAPNDTTAAGAPAPPSPPPSLATLPVGATGNAPGFVAPPAAGSASRTTMPLPPVTIDPTTGQPVGASATAGTTSSSTNPFTDPTQMQLWNAVQYALTQAQQPVGNNPQTTALQNAITQLAQQLSGPAFTDQQLNDIRTASMDSIQADEDNAVQAEIQRQELLGQSASSGTVTDSVNKIKAAYTTLKGQAQQANNMYELNTVTQRQQELLQTLNLGATTATGNQELGVQNANTAAELSTLPVSAENTALSNAAAITQQGNPLQIYSALLPYLNSLVSSGEISAAQAGALGGQLGTFFGNMFGGSSSSSPTTPSPGPGYVWNGTQWVLV